MSKYFCPEDAAAAYLSYLTQKLINWWKNRKATMTTDEPSPPKKEFPVKIDELVPRSPTELEIYEDEPLTWQEFNESTKEKKYLYEQ